VQDTPAGKQFLKKVHEALDGALIQVAYTEGLSPDNNEAPAVASKLLDFSNSWSDESSASAAEEKTAAVAFSSTTGSWQLRNVSDS
jgi:hypothetical protein